MPKINIPKGIHDEIRPIFLDLSKDELLAKCLHGETQNNNESWNNMIWAKCPKNVFVTKPLLQLGVNSAVIGLNEGGNGAIRVLEKLGIDIGKETVGGTARKNKIEIKKMNLKTRDSTTMRRKHLRKVRKGFLDKERETEKEEPYVTGGFS